MKKEATMLRVRKTICLTIGVVLFSALGAGGQSGAPVPWGNWATNPASEKLYVSASWCRFTGTNGTTSTLIEGQCSWNPSSAGGILTIMNVHFYKPAPVYYNVVWVNSKTIKVFGDVFYKQ